MADIKYDPVPHDHEAFLIKARKRKGFSEAYDNLEEEYLLCTTKCFRHVQSQVSLKRLLLNGWVPLKALCHGWNLQASTLHQSLRSKSMHEPLAVICRSS